MKSENGPGGLNGSERTHTSRSIVIYGDRTARFVTLTAAEVTGCEVQAVNARQNPMQWMFSSNANKNVGGA